VKPKKIKIIVLSLLLITIAGCASIAPVRNKSLRLTDGSNIIIENGKAIKITDKTGATVAVKKGMMVLANGDFIYIRQNGTVKITEMNNSAHTHNSNNSDNDH
jgi:hypothetical protein